MRKLFITLMLCITGTLTFAQNFVQKVQSKVTINITSTKPDSIWVDGYGARFYVHPEKDNRYVLQFKHDKPLEIKVGFNKQEARELHLCIVMGTNMNIVSDFVKNASFIGKGAEEARTFYEWDRDFIAAYEKIDFMKLNATALFNQLMEIGQHSIAILEKNKAKVSSLFYKYQCVALKYNKLALAFSPIASSSIVIPIPYLYKNMGKKASESVPQHYWDIKSEVVLDEKLLDNPAYLNFVKNIYPLFLNCKKRFENGLLDSELSIEENTKLTLAEIAKNYTGKMRSVAVSAILISEIKNMNDITAVKQMMDNYVSKYCMPEDKKLAMVAYQKQHSTSVGQVPPSFIVKDINGKSITLKDFIGKVIYIDFWASWCAACREEMKNGSPKLHEKFKDNKDIVFLNISVDSNIDSWKKAVAQDKTKGIHTISQTMGFSDNPLNEIFYIPTIPRYMIIGRDGKMINNEAPWPSEDITVEKINEALKHPN